MSCIGSYRRMQHASEVVEQKPENIEIEFFQDGRLIGREMRSDSIIKMHGTVEDVAKHLLGFYSNTKGRVDVKASYRNNKHEFHLDAC